jgi:hypothetical protein
MAAEWVPAVTAGITAAAALGGQAIAGRIQGRNQGRMEARQRREEQRRPAARSSRRCPTRPGSPRGRAVPVAAPTTH